MAGAPCEANLADDPPRDRVQLVKYIPQGRFEALCNEHASGASDAFERELREVIFSHTPADRRLHAMTYDELIEGQERGFRERLGELRKNLGLLNQRLVAAEGRLHPDIKSNLEEQLRLKRTQIKELTAAKPVEVPEPAAGMTPEQQAASDALVELERRDGQRENVFQMITASQQAAAERRQSSRAVQEQIELFENQFKALIERITPDVENLGLTVEQVIRLTIDREPLAQGLKQAETAMVDAVVQLRTNAEQKTEIESERVAASGQLNEPQKRRQSYLEATRQWQEQIDPLRGTPDVPDSELGLAARLEHLARLPEHLATMRATRDQQARNIFAVLEEQRSQRADLFKPLQDLMATNALIRDDYKLQFQSKLAVYDNSISTKLFAIVKQNAGALRGEDESYGAVKALCDRHGFADANGALGFINGMTELLTASAERSQVQLGGIQAILRKDRKPEEVYDFLYGLEYLEPKYTLLFQETSIEQLSPGQRGALLLIFYLLVDKGRNPIILDQPEENLDNETTVSLLVPVINDAKKTRQILMVTHNPNLAVVCDADQIIAANFERRNQSTIRYYSGSIEDARSNAYVVTILEGTRPAFENRSQKYL